MKQQMMQLVVVALLGAMACTISQAAVRYAVGSGNWSDNSATWGGLGVPGVGDTVVVFVNAIVTIDAIATCKRLELGENSGGFFGGNGSITITSPTAILSVSDDIIVGEGSTSGSIYMSDGSLWVGGSLNFVNGTLTPDGGKVTYISGDQTVAGITYHDLSLAGSGVKSADGPIIVKGKLSINSASSFAAKSFTHSIKGDLTNDGTITPGTGTIQINGFAQTINGACTFNNLYLAAGTKTANGELTVNGGLTIHVTASLEPGSFTHSLKGDVIADGALLPGTGTIRLNGNASQTISGDVTFNNLILGNGSTKTAVGPLTVNGDFTINANTTFDAGSFTHTFNGGWTNEGVFSAGTGTITMGGSNQQTITGNNRFNNLTISNASGVRFFGSGSDTVDGTLAFTAGRLQLGASDLLLRPSAAVTGADAGKCIVTNGSGRVSRRISGGTGAGSFQFPIAPNSTSYNPVTIALRPTGAEPSELFHVRVSLFDSGTPGFATVDTSRCVHRVWDIAEESPGGNHANLTFQWKSDEDGANIGVQPANPVQLRAYRYDPGILSFVDVDEASGPAPINDPIIAATPGYLATSFDAWIVGQPGLATDVGEETRPLAFALEQNYPNPFNPATNIRFGIPNSEFVSLKVYDLLGRDVATLVDEVRPAGSYDVRFDASHLSSGVYLYRLTTPSHSVTKRLMLVK